MKFRNFFISMTMAFILALGFGPLASEARADNGKCCTNSQKYKYEKKGKKNQKHGKKEKKCKNNKQCGNEKVVIIKKEEPRVIVQKKPAVEVVISIPVGSVRIVIRGEVFHFFNGQFYRPVPGGYRHVAPPSGAYQHTRLAMVTLD